MQLRALLLNGFKTFARRTEIHFEDGFTAIVGPNGSGKTNIVEAFRWVLGETQARDLRGRRMEEVIYAGGARRPRAAAAEVTLVIDNADGRLPVDYTEVAIRRRVDRSGMSDYFLNETRVRRRDVLDLLASTGLTVDSYAIVQQGDIESIVTCTPAQRRLLVEEAAQVRGVKAKRTEAAERLRELAQNLRRLEDVSTEIQPRLLAVREQAEAAREAAAARQRLAMLRGSIAWEEWREARDVHRRAQSQVQSLQRRLAEARAEAEVAEQQFRTWRLELEAAQDRRLERQARLGGLQLELAAREHELALGEERARNQTLLAANVESEEKELAARGESARSSRAQLSDELAAAERELAALPREPEEPDIEAAAEDAAQARRRALEARRQAMAAHSAYSAAASRRGVLTDTVAALEPTVSGALARLPEVEERAARSAAAAAAAGEATATLKGVRAELSALQEMMPTPSDGLRRLRDVVRPKPGFDAAVSAALGPLLDAWVAPDEETAVAAARGAPKQRTVVYPGRQPGLRPGSLLHQVDCEPGYEALARDLLGGIVVGSAEGRPYVTSAGEYREAGLVRRGADPASELAARMRRLREQVRELEPLAVQEPARREEASRQASELETVRRAASAAGELEEARRRLAEARRQEEAEGRRLPELERAAAQAEELALAVTRTAADRDRRLAEHRAELRRIQLEALRWRERIADLHRQLAGVDGELAKVEQARERLAHRLQAAQRAGAEAEGSLPACRSAVEAARRELSEEEERAPEQEAELAAGARKLVALEEARVDTRLKVTTLEGNLGLVSREAELALARMAELRSAMPEGLAPEEVPGGKAREREMKALERRLEEIGPTNALAESELAELEERYETLTRQLEDISAARADLEVLTAKLREEEERRYDAVFGAVAANFQELFAELSAGGRATLRHVDGEDGPRSGVEIIVQPPKKRLQNVGLLSSGERSLTALALVLALEAVNPSPFVVLDEVDAALDDANVSRFSSMLQRLSRERQFLVITHNHATMAAASSLYGVHLDESGCSHLVSVRLEDVRRPAARAASA